MTFSPILVTVWELAKQQPVHQLLCDIGASIEKDDNVNSPIERKLLLLAGLKLHQEELMRPERHYDQ